MTDSPSEKRQGDPKNPNLGAQRPRITIAELEWMLAAPDGFFVTEIQPDGSVSAVLGPKALELAPLSERTRTDTAPQVGDSLTAGPAQHGEPAAVVPDEFKQLASFYNVQDMAALVRIQAEHVESLQAKLPPTPPFPGIQRVREG